MESNESGRDVSYEIIPKEIEALKHAIGMAEEGTFITALSERISNAIDLVQEYQARNYWKMIRIYKINL
jgi:cyanophycin synthetase